MKMKRLFKKIVMVLCIISMLCTTIFCFTLKFQNIDMTEARLFVTYWKESIIAFCILVGSGVLFDRITKSL